MRFILIFTLLLFPQTVNTEEIRSFTSDGCSSFLNGTSTQQELWLNCCTAHDYAHWQGGSYDERLIVDKALQQCVAKVGQPEIVTLMLAGVRLGVNLDNDILIEVTVTALRST